MELTAAIEEAGPDVQDVTAFAVNSARDVAVQVAAQNGTYVDADFDVEFGRRSIDPDTGQASVTWGVTPANTVRVRARRDNDDLAAPDGKVPVMFAGVGGSDASTLLADLLMTDGVPTMGETYTVPSDWDWNVLFDWDHDSAADYRVPTSDTQYDTKMSTLVHAKQAVDAGITIHTLTVGNDADQALMDAIAWMGRGQSLHVPAGLTPEELQTQVTEAFQRLTAIVPPPKMAE